MLRELDAYYDRQEEPYKSCLMALRIFILNYDPKIEETWKWKLPFFMYNGKMFCYLWAEKKTRTPYIAIYDGARIANPRLVQLDGAKIWKLLIDPEQDLPVEDIEDIFSQSIRLPSLK